MVPKFYFPKFYDRQQLTRGDMLTAYYAVHAALIGGVLLSLIWRLTRKQRIEEFGTDAVMISLVAVVALVGFALGRAFLTA
jgi:nitrate reductase gamma subunit